MVKAARKQEVNDQRDTIKASYQLQLDFLGKPADLFLDRLPKQPRCTDNPQKEGLYRLPLAEALTRLHIQPNTAKLHVCLCFDIDRPGAAVDWEDRNAPAPNLAVTNPANGHAHLIYHLEAPVSVSEIARIKPVLFMAAVQEGLRRALEADRGYAGVVVKNPFHAHWQTTAFKQDAYSLEELAEYVTLPTPAELRRRSKQADYAGLGRNCTLFEITRKQAYSLVREYWRPNGASDFQNAVLDLVQAANVKELGNPLQASECRAIARSIAKWTWQNFTPAQFRKVQKARGARKGASKREMLLPTAQSMAAEGKSVREIAAALGVSHMTISRWLKVQ